MVCVVGAAPSSRAPPTKGGGEAWLAYGCGPGRSRAGFGAEQAKVPTGRFWLVGRPAEGGHAGLLGSAPKKTAEFGQGG